MKSYAEKDEKNLYAFAVNCKAKRVRTLEKKLTRKQEKILRWRNFARKLNSDTPQTFPNFKVIFNWRCHDDQNSNIVSVGKQ